MKLHYVLAAGAAALLLLAGCESGVSEVPEVSEVGKAVSVPLWFEQIGGPSTKVDVDGDTGFGSWTEGDQIAIYVQGTGANFYQIKNVESIEDAPSNNIGHVMVSLAAGQDRANYAIYPASAAVDGHVSSGDLYVSYPAEYDYSKLTVAQMETYTPAPMVAINTPVADFDDPTVESESLNFYHVGGVLRLTVPGVPQSAYALRITFPESFKVSGTFQVADGGTANATLTDAGLDDHSNVIDIKIPVPETATQDLVLNIPMPSADYTTDARDFKIEVRTERIAYMKSDGIINFASILRAQGKKQIVPTVETLGTMSEMYMARGYLKRPDQTSVIPDQMSLSGTDQMEPLNSFNNNVYGKRLYFSWVELGKIMTGDSSFDGSTSFETATLDIGGVEYRVATVEEYNRIVRGGDRRPGAIVNGAPGKYYSIVKVNIEGLGFPDYFHTTWNDEIVGMMIYPDGGVFNCSAITSFNSGGVNATTISYADYRRLTDGPNACVFLVSGGDAVGDNWYGGGSAGLYWASTRYNDSRAYMLNFSASGANPTNNYGITDRFPVKLIRVDQ